MSATPTISSWDSNRKWTPNGSCASFANALEQFGLQLHPEKTRLIEFGRYAAERREKRGEGKPETFNFLGFTHCCGTTLKGAFTIKRKSIAKRIRGKLQEIKQQLKSRMHSKVNEVGSWLRSVVRGWLNYHAVPGNIHGLDEFCTQVDDYGYAFFGGVVRKDVLDLDAVSAFGAALDTESSNPSSLSQ